MDEMIKNLQWDWLKQPGGGGGMDTTSNGFSLQPSLATRPGQNEKENEKEKVIGSGPVGMSLNDAGQVFRNYVAQKIVPHAEGTLTGKRKREASSLQIGMEDGKYGKYDLLNSFDSPQDVPNGEEAPKKKAKKMKNATVPKEKVKAAKKPKTQKISQNVPSERLLLEVLADAVEEGAQLAIYIDEVTRAAPDNTKTIFGMIEYLDPPVPPEVSKLFQERGIPIRQPECPHVSPIPLKHDDGSPLSRKEMKQAIKEGQITSEHVGRIWRTLQNDPTQKDLNRATFLFVFDGTGIFTTLLEDEYKLLFETEVARKRWEGILRPTKSRAFTVELALKNLQYEVYPKTNVKTTRIVPVYPCEASLWKAKELDPKTIPRDQLPSANPTTESCRKELEKIHRVTTAFGSSSNAPLTLMPPTATVFGPSPMETKAVVEHKEKEKEKEKKITSMFAEAPPNNQMLLLQMANGSDKEKEKEELLRLWNEFGQKVIHFLSRSS
jgi:hypothetical protein